MAAARQEDLNTPIPVSRVLRRKLLHGGHGLVLDPADFYILATREAVVVPPDHAAEMIAYDTQVGEGGARLSGVNFSGAEMDKAVGLKQAQLSRACGDESTTLPHGLHLAACK